MSTDPSHLAIDVHELEVLVGRKQRILGPISLQVEAGEHVLLTGPSGAGKSTLLRTLAGLQIAHAGTIALHGQLASEPKKIVLPPAQRGVGMLFQEGALWPHMTVLRTLTFVLAHRGVPRSQRKQRARELLEQVHLEGYESRRPASLSGGEAQRLALARALASEARILLLDEPLGPLDPDLRRELLASLEAVQARHQLTILHVTHDADEAASIATRRLHLEKGQWT